MTKSILFTVKKMLGLDETYDAFDQDVITNINSVFLTLNQLGVGPSGFQITGDSEEWSDFVDPAKYPGIQSYVYLKTRLLFDPPTNSFLVDNIQKQIAEFEFRLNVQAEYVDTNDEVETSQFDPLLATFSMLKSSSGRRKADVQSSN